jgi:hypothetical protein
MGTWNEPEETFRNGTMEPMSQTAATTTEQWRPTAIKRATKEWLQLLRGERCSFYDDVTRMWLPLQHAAEVTYTCFPSFYIYLLLARMDNNNNNVHTHFGYVHHLNNKNYALSES